MWCYCCRAVLYKPEKMTYGKTQIFSASVNLFFSWIFRNQSFEPINSIVCKVNRRRLSEVYIWTFGNISFFVWFWRSPYNYHSFTFSAFGLRYSLSHCVDSWNGNQFKVGAVRTITAVLYQPCWRWWWFSFYSWFLVEFKYSVCSLLYSVDT